MVDLVRPLWLNAAPNQQLEHSYLTEAQIAALPDGEFYKRKARLTRHRFVKATLRVDGRAETVEFVDNRGSWRIEPHMCDRIAALAGGTSPPAVTAQRLHQLGLSADLDDATRRQLGILDSLGLAPLVLPMSLPPAPGNTRHPRTMDDIVDLYGEYTDMEAQGHFAADSPDLERFDRMIQWVPRSAAVLDLGCNSGTFGQRLIANGCQVTGIDLALELLKIARSRGLSTVRAFAEQLPLAGDSFDVVLCGELLEHSLDPAAIARQTCRVLRPGGVMIGSVPHADGQWGTEDLAFHPEHLWAFGPDSLAELLGEAGLGHLETVDLHHGHDRPQGMVFRAWKSAPDQQSATRQP